MGGWSYDYNVSLSPNIWIMTFLIWTLTLDFGWTMKKDEGVKLFRGFGDGQMNDICDCRVAFATENSKKSDIGTIRSGTYKVSQNR